MKKVVNTDNAPHAIGPYSQAVVSGGLVFLSGQIPLDPSTGKIVGGDISAQTDRVLLNMKAILAEAGTSLNEVLKTTVYMTDLGMFQDMNRVYETYFDGYPPARATVQVVSLPAGALIEIDAVARLGK